MKNIRMLGLAVAAALPLLFAAVPAEAQVAATMQANLSPAAGEVVRLSEAGSNEEVVLAYVQNSPGGFNLSADQILYLSDIGLSSPVITAMLNRDNALRGQPQPTTYNQTAYPAAPGTAPAVAPAPPADTAVAAPAPVYVSSPPADVGYFYEQLSPYGSWIQLEGVGWCWQPRVVAINRAWRPYCDSGHWVYSDAGWFWVSNYSWGWAPFHYGRWQMHPRCGWVWLPDRTWGPAWVTWRATGDFCGWAPLPPHADFDIRLGWRFNGVSVGASFGFGLGADHFAFIALKDFNHHDLSHRRLPSTEVTRVYKQTTIINNYVVNNNTIVNRGIKAERVAAATHTEIRRAAIRDLPAGQRAGMSRATGREEAVVYRSELAAPARPTRMVAQRVDERHPVVRHAPVTPGRVERRAPPSGNVSAPVTIPRPSQSETPRMASRPSSDQPVPRTPDHSAPKAPQPAVSAPPAVAAPQAPADTRPAAQPQPASGAPARAPMGRHNATPAISPGFASHVYYPKSYHQAVEAHALPPLNPRSPSLPSSAAHRGDDPATTDGRQ